MLTARPDQSRFRQSVTYHDQHGRPWIAIIDTQSRGSEGLPRISPCTPLQPKDWTAPLDVPQKYLTIPEGTLGRVEIDYQAWYDDAVAGEREREDIIRVAAMAMYGQQSAAAIKNPPPELVAYVGRGPIPSTFIRAARAENRWVLGLPQENGQPYPTPKWAEPIIGMLIYQPVPLGDDTEFADETFADETFIDTSAEDAPLDDIAARLNTEHAVDTDEEFDADALGGHTVPVATRPPRRHQGNRR